MSRWCRTCRASPTTKLSYTVNNGVPISAHAEPAAVTTSYRTRNMSLYVQDQWTRGRMTLQGALRFDRNGATRPSNASAATNCLRPPIVFPETDGVPATRHLAARRRRLRPVRHGKTAVKVNFGESLDRQQQQQLHPFEPDRPHRHDDVAELDRQQRQLGSRLRSAEQGGAEPATTGSDVCGASNANFGTTALTTAAIDPEILDGWGVRPTTGRSAYRCSSRCCPACRSRSATSAAG